MWKPVAAQINRAMKATTEKLTSLNVRFVNAIITKVYFNDGFLNLIVAPEDENYDDTIFLKVSNTELIRYHDCYLLEAITDAIKSVKITDFVVRAQLLKEANEVLQHEFLDKTALIAVQELDAGDAIVQLDGSLYTEEATTSWTKFLLYEWK